MAVCILETFKLTKINVKVVLSSIKTVNKAETFNSNVVFKSVVQTHSTDDFHDSDV